MEPAASGVLVPIVGVAIVVLVVFAVWNAVRDVLRGSFTVSIAVAILAAIGGLGYLAEVGRHYWQTGPATILGEGPSGDQAASKNRD
jgi:hypothetical protein